MIITNNKKLPQVFVDIVNENYAYKENEYSVTEILNGIREIKLTRLHYNEIEQDVSNMTNLIFGTAVHHLLEIKEKKNITEQKVKAEVIKGLFLKGRFDAYDKDTGTLIDYKTAKVYKIIVGDFEDWRKQGLMYAWLCRKNGIFVERVKFIVMLKDWSKNIYYKANYPDSSIYVYEFKIDSLALKEIEEWIIDRFKLLASDVDEVCTKEERWHNPTKYAAMKYGSKRAKKICNTKAEAEKIGDYVEERKGCDRKCEDYCNVKRWCNYYKEKIN